MQFPWGTPLLESLILVFSGLFLLFTALLLRTLWFRSAKPQEGLLQTDLDFLESAHPAGLETRHGRAKPPLIKGNINSKGERIYHAPGKSVFYGVTKIDPKRGERWFRTEEEAQAAGWRAPVKSVPQALNTGRIH